MKTYQIDEELLEDILINIEDYQCRLLQVQYFLCEDVDEDMEDAERVINKLKELKMKEFLPVVFLFVIPSVVMVLGLIAFLWCICK